MFIDWIRRLAFSEISEDVWTEMAKRFAELENGKTDQASIDARVKQSARDAIRVGFMGPQ